MPEYLAPGVYIEETSFRAKTIEGVGTSTAAFVGETQTGPLDEAVLITSYDQFEQYYGKSLSNRYLGWSVQLFFANGGERLYIARVDADAKTALDERRYQAAFGLLDSLDDFSLVAVPGAGTSSMSIFATEYCQKRRDCFYIADTVQSVDTVSEAQTVMNTLRDKSTYAALYFPWLKVKDMNRATVITVPPSGAVAGVYARTDATRGVWKAPAGTEASVLGVAGLAMSVSNREQELLNPLGLNVIRDNVAHNIVVWGANTLTRNDAEFRYVPVRRTAIFIEHSIKKGIQWAVYEPNDEMLWSQLRLQISNFMQGLFRQGAFQGAKSDEAYFVRCDQQTTTQKDIDNGMVNIQVGFAPLKPAEFVIIKLQQKAGQTT